MNGFATSIVCIAIRILKKLLFEEQNSVAAYLLIEINLTYGCLCIVKNCLSAG